MTRVITWAPRHERTPVQLTGRATLGDGRVIDVTVMNVSRDGCEISSDETLLIGAMITVDVPSLKQASGQVRWSLFGRAGLRFPTMPR
jgi:hypothetical protein